MKKHGFTISPDRLKGFTLPVTEFGRSRNDYCFIHHDNFYKTDKVNIGVILSPSTRAVSSYDMEIGSTATGVIEFKNSGYSIDQTVAEMLRIAGDIALMVLTDRKQLNQIFISAIAANYSTGKAKLVKMELDCIEETSIVNQSIETIPL